MATKSLVSATATLGIERRGGQGREDPGIPGCHPRSRPRVPRLLPPPLAAAFAGLRGAPHAPRANGRCRRRGQRHTRSPAARPEENGDRAGQRRGGRGEEERRGAVKLCPSAPRARLRARPSSSAPASASCAPPLPAACRPARPALPGPPPTELCRYHFRREKRARRRTRALYAGERKYSEAEPPGRNGRCAGMGRFCGRARRTPRLFGSSWDGVCPLSTHPPDTRGGSTPIPVSFRPHIPSRRP